MGYESFAIWNPNSVYDKEYLDEIYSYSNPEARVLLINNELDAQTILGVKKTNAEYVYAPDSHGIYALYLIDNIPLPSASLLQSQPVSIVTAPIGKNPQAFWSHKAVVRSIQNGLLSIGAIHNCNPRSIKKLYPHVLVLCNDEPAIQMLNFKNAGNIQKVFLGPNYTFDSTTLHLFGMNICDGWLVPSLWTKNEISKINKKMKDRIQIWKTGVDINHWQPECTNKEREVLLYDKYDSKFFIDSIKQLLNSFGWNVTLIKYGEYSEAAYKYILNKAVFAVIVSPSESQGIALAEAWAMNVPTLVWDNRGLFTFNHFYQSNSAPFLNPNVGLRWKNLTELEGILSCIDETLTSFSPRKWVMRNMSDEVSALDLLLLFKDVPCVNITP